MSNKEQTLSIIIDAVERNLDNEIKIFKIKDFQF